MTYVFSLMYYCIVKKQLGYRIICHINHKTIKIYEHILFPPGLFKITDVSQRNCKKKVFYYRKSVWRELINKAP